MSWVSFMVANPVEAASAIIISSFPSSIIAGKEFEVGFRASGLDPNSSYYVKGLGGVNFTEIDTWNNDWFQQNASWASMPSFSASDGSPSGNIKVRFDGNTESGSKDFKIRIRKSDSESSNIDSAIVTISVSAAPTSPTPAENPTPIPTQLPTIKPTPAETLPPTKKPVAKPTTQPSPEVLSLETFSETPSPTTVPLANDRKFPILGIALIVLGTFSIGAAGYVAYRQRKPVNPESLIQ